jgi:hypothetical protein
MSGEGGTFEASQNLLEQVARGTDNSPRLLHLVTSSEAEQFEDYQKRLNELTLLYEESAEVPGTIVTKQGIKYIGTISLPYSVQDKGLHVMFTGNSDDGCNCGTIYRAIPIEEVDLVNSVPIEQK